MNDNRIQQMERKQNIKNAEMAEDKVFLNLWSERMKELVNYNNFKFLYRNKMKKEKNKK